MYLLKNGDQIAFRTFDGVMHKMNIVNNRQFRVEQNKKGNELTFVMINCGKSYFLSNKNAKFIDYDLVDRILHSVQIDTKKFQSLYHNLIWKQ